MWLAQAAGRPCFNLDAYLMDEAALLRRFHAESQGVDIAIVEGNKGLYDGLALDGSNSNAALARQLGAPVLLVIDARGMTRGLAPLVRSSKATRACTTAWRSTAATATQRWHANWVRRCCW